MVRCENIFDFQKNCCNLNRNKWIFDIVKTITEFFQCTYKALPMHFQCTYRHLQALIGSFEVEMYIKPWSINPQHLHFRKSLQLEELSHCGMKESGPQWNSLQDCLLGDGEMNTIYINRLRRWFQCRWKGKRRQWRNPRGWYLKYWICKCLSLLRAGNGNQKLRF